MQVIPDSLMFHQTRIFPKEAIVATTKTRSFFRSVASAFRAAGYARENLQPAARDLSTLGIDPLTFRGISKG